MLLLSAMATRNRTSYDDDDLTQQSTAHADDDHQEPCINMLDVNSAPGILKLVEMVQHTHTLRFH